MPGLVGAILTILIGYLIGVLIGTIVRKSMHKAQIDQWMKDIGRAKALGGLQLSTIAGNLIKWWVFIAFLAPAADMIQLAALSTLLNDVALWVPQLIAAIAIVVTGLIIADYFADAVAAAEQLKHISLIDSIVRVATIVFFVDIALRELGVNIVLAEATILIIVAGIVLTLSIAFGWGMRKEAEKMVQEWREKATQSVEDEDS